MRNTVQWLVFAGLLAAVAALWAWGPLAHLDRATVVEQISALNQHWFGVFVAGAAFLVVGALMAPQTPLIVGCAIVFGPALGFAVSMAGLLTTAVAGYGIGEVVGARTLRRKTSSRLHQISEALGRRGVMAMVVVALVPFAPSGLVYFVAGASHIRFRDFLIGSAIGMVPGVAGLSLLADQAVRAVREPTPFNLGLLIGGGVIAVAALALVARRYGRRWWSGAQE